jgi:hypothetical protein
MALDSAVFKGGPQNSPAGHSGIALTRLRMFPSKAPVIDEGKPNVLAGIVLTERYQG